MKKLLIIAGILLFSLQTTQAQRKLKNVKVKWTKEKKTKKSFYTDGIFAFDDTGFYMTVTTGKFTSRTYLQHYDKNFNLDKSIELNPGKSRKRKQFHSAIHINNNIYCFSTYKDSKTRNHSLFLQQIDKKTLKPDKQIKKIASIDFTKKTKRNAGDYSILISRDSTKVLVYYNLPYKKKEKEKFGFFVFDNNMNEIWKKNVTLPYTDELFIIEDFVIDNDGVVHVLGKLYNEKKRDKRKGKVNYKFQILSYYNNGDEFKKYDIKLKGKYVKDIIMTVNDNNDIICGGFYADTNGDLAKGTYFITIDHNTKEIISESYKDFDADFLTQYLSKGKKKRVKKRMEKGKEEALYHYDLQDIVTKSDGGAILIGEYFKIVSVTSTLNNSTVTNDYYYFGNLVVINISPEGQILWAKKVPKLQRSMNSPGFFTSYALMVTDDHIYLIYNDNPKNLTTSNNSKGKIYMMNGPKKSIITIASIDKNGKLTRGIIPKPNKSKIYINPEASVQLDDNTTMVLFGERGKKYRFARLIFKD